MKSAAKLKPRRSVTKTRCARNFSASKGTSGISWFLFLLTFAGASGSKRSIHFRNQVFTSLGARHRSGRQHLVLGIQNNREVGQTGLRRRIKGASHQVLVEPLRGATRIARTRGRPGGFAGGSSARLGHGDSLLGPPSQSNSKIDFRIDVDQRRQARRANIRRDLAATDITLIFINLPHWAA